ncbi:rCG38013, isoform CRA_b, partial [Rattus norvegicus]
MTCHWVPYLVFRIHRLLLIYHKIQSRVESLIYSPHFIPILDPPTTP